MWLSDISIKRPVFAAVISLLLVAFGLISFERLSLREYPDIDAPIVTIDTKYPGASAAIVESRITQLIEDRIAGVEGIRTIESSSNDGRSRITVEFSVDRDIDGAANDMRDRVSGLLDNLPDDADPPEIEKADSDDSVIMWLNLVSDRMNTLELSDYAERYLVDRFSSIDGVARVRIGGAQRYAMRVWLDRDKLAARGLTAVDIEASLLAENVELPAGVVESKDRMMTLRVDRAYRTADDFAKLVIARSDRNGYLVRLGDVARVERASTETRNMFRGNGIDQVSIGIIKQSQANAVQVARDALNRMEQVNAGLPEGIQIKESFNTAVFVEQAIKEVWKTLGIAIILVIVVIYLFLGSFRVMMIPAVTVPVSVIGTSIMLYGLGFSINMLTLLSMVLAIGLVVDDAIVVLENIVRRMKEEGEPPLVAAYRGARQVGFAVIATTAVLIATFAPLAFMEGKIGRLFTEFSLTMVGAVLFSSVVALSLSAMLASKLLSADHKPTMIARTVDRAFQRLSSWYRARLSASLKHPMLGLIIFASIFASAGLLYKITPSEYAPREDRGISFMFINGPQGATYEYMTAYVDEVEARLMPMVEAGEISRLLVRLPRGFSSTNTFHQGMGIMVMEDWAARRPIQEILQDVRMRLADLPGITASPIMPAGFGQRSRKPVQFVIGGGTYEELVVWRDMMRTAIKNQLPYLINVDHDYKETKPQLRITVDKDRAAVLGVSLLNIGQTLSTFLGSRRVSSYVDNGEEYDVIFEGERDQLNNPGDIEGIYVRSSTSGALIPLSNLVVFEEFADSPTLPRFNRVRSITIEANISDGRSLGDALTQLEQLARKTLPETAVYDYKGESREFRESAGALIFVFVLGIVVVFLVMAAQFESFVHPTVIILSVPLAIAGGLFGIWLTGGTLNLFTQIGLIMLVGLSAKNGILIVEFINQLRDGGMGFDDAIIEAAQTRLRPIIMTGITTAAGSIPLILATGAGAETRSAIGIVVFSGVIAATALTLFAVPLAYKLIARNTGSPGDVTRNLAAQQAALQAKIEE